MNDWAMLPLYQAQVQLIPPLVRSLAEACQDVAAPARAHRFATLLEGIGKLRAPAEQLYRQAWDELTANQLADEEAVGSLLRDTFDQLLVEIASVRALLAADTEAARTVIDETEQAIRQLRDDLERTWPWLDQEQIRAACGAYARGDYEEAGSILRDLQDDHSAHHQGPHQ